MSSNQKSTVQIKILVRQALCAAAKRPATHVSARVQQHFDNVVATVKRLI
jgi:hypothetical protein